MFHRQKNNTSKGFFEKISLKISFCFLEILESIELDRVQRIELNLLCFHLETQILYHSIRTLLFCGTGPRWSGENPFRDPTGSLLRWDSGDFQWHLYPWRGPWRVSLPKLKWQGYPKKIYSTFKNEIVNQQIERKTKTSCS